MTRTRRLTLTAAVFGAIYLACFYYRLDYPAHLIAGFGLAAVLWTVIAPRVDSLGRLCALVIVSTLVLAIIGEMTVFGPEFDLADVANTLMGAALGCAALVGAARSRSSEPSLPVVGAILIVGGLLLRYRVQQVASRWWFGV